jgi:hypothetical protein
VFKGIASAVFLGPILVVAPAAAHGQAVQFLTPTWVGAPSEDYLRLLQLTGAALPASWLMRPASSDIRLPVADSAANPWRRTISLGDTTHRPWKFGVFDLGLRSAFNSELPSTENANGLWSGRGASAILEGGIEAEIGPIRLTLAPSFGYSQNEPFALAPVGADLLAHGFTPYANADYTASIDLPQRFGSTSLWRFFPGQSALSVGALGVSLGVSTANQWWGPGTFNSLLMTNNAPGFGHAFLASQPQNIGIGELEGEWVVGRLFGSGVSTVQPDPSADRRWLNALGLVFAPRFAPTLYVGAIRMFYRYLPKDGLHARDLLDVFQSLEKIGLPASEQFSDAADQMLTFTVRWVLPSSGFELYGEWARNDHSWDTRDFVLDPTHASAYVLGMQKVLRHHEGFVRLGMESVSLPASPANLRRDVPTFYNHPQIMQGYTQEGQLIGASVGPVGSGQYVRVDVFRIWGRLGGAFALVRHANFLLGPTTATPTRPALTISGSRIFSRLTWDAALTYERQLNQYYEPDHDVSNIRLQLGGSWRLGNSRSLSR